MLRNVFLAASAAAYILLTRATDALAAGDPSKVGDKLFNIVSPNVKSLWKLGVLVAIVGILFTRPKGSFVAATFIAIVVSGVIIFNTTGFSHMVNAVGDKIL
jgi:hypothetical protein